MRTLTRTTSAMVAVLVAAVLVTAPTAAVAADPPFAAEAAFRWKKVLCIRDATDQPRVIASAKSTVRQVRSPDKTYYQEIRTQVDGWQAIGSRWKQIEGRWRDHPRFTAADRPTWSTPAIKAAVSGKTVYTAKFTIKLRQVRRGPDPTVWQYTVRSDYFGCPDSMDGA